MTTGPGAQLNLFGGENCCPLVAHVWRKEPNGFYVEPEWCSEQLFQAETFTKSIWDPCCGIGHIAESARRVGYEVFASDIVDRGYQHFGGCLDFLQCERPRGANYVFTITINGAAAPKGRPRMTRRGFVYTPAATRKYEAHARLAAQLAMGDRSPLQTPVRIELSVELPVPISWSNKRRLAALAGAIVPTSIATVIPLDAAASNSRIPQREAVAVAQEA